MKRFAALLLILALCLAGCGKKTPADIPGASTPPEGVDWKLWETYVPVTLNMGQEQVDVLITLDTIHLAVYYDRQEQELLGDITIFTPLSDVTYSLEHLRVVDMNGDGFDDIGILDMLENGDRTLEFWVWDANSGAFLYAPEYSQSQEGIGADISWQKDKHFISSSMATPEDAQDVLILVEEPYVYVYLDRREQELWAVAELPEPLSQEAKEHLSQYTYWESWDADGDGWADLQLPYRWETRSDGSVCLYSYCWLWDAQTGAYRYDPALSAIPTM